MSTEVSWIYDGDDPWVFRASETDPVGIQVDVVIAVPNGVAWKDMRELAEVAQMTASRAMTQAIVSRERPPK
jgi:hypothetical protein